GIGKLNGWDGLWGIEYKSTTKGILNGAVIEYMDYTNQSGPIHFAPADHDGVTITGHASGADDYYNNTAHRSYANYGMAIGSPAFMAPIYNLNGYPAFMANAMRGIHVGVEGAVTDDIDYRVKAGYRKAWGSGKVLLPVPINSTSVMVEAVWRVRNLKGLSVTGQIEVDRGSMPCNMAGALVSVRYDGVLNL
ncbi:MAG: capsule assembly Wzi family protein, partial [Duncaniella sp.]|nr:capsule assembly Wzi family protein [Duncaniella sp.]